VKIVWRHFVFLDRERMGRVGDGFPVRERKAMPTELPRVLVEIAYEKAAREYLRRLPLEHFMASKPQATQREITLESLALVKAQRPDVQVFNELLVQYPLPRRKRPGQVVPDNMVVIHPQPIEAEGSYILSAGLSETLSSSVGRNTTQEASLLGCVPLRIRRWPGFAFT
jgi:hypothetical protein